MIAGLLVCLAALFTTIFDWTGALHVTDLPVMFGVYIIFSYILGVPIAFLAGLLMSIWMISRPPGFIVAIGSSDISVGLYRLVAEPGFLSPARTFQARANFALIMALAVISAGFCWLLTRRLVSAHGHGA